MGGRNAKGPTSKEAHAINLCNYELETAARKTEKVEKVCQKEK